MHNFTSQGRLISQEKRGLIFDSTSHCLLLSISRNSCDIDFISFTFICAKSLTRSIPISRTTKVTTLHYQFHHCFWISQGHRDCFSSSFRLVWTRLPKHVVGLLRASKATFTHPISFFFFFFFFPNDKLTNVGIFPVADWWRVGCVDELQREGSIQRCCHYHLQISQKRCQGC